MDTSTIPLTLIILSTTFLACAAEIWTTPPLALIAPVVFNQRIGHVAGNGNFNEVIAVEVERDNFAGGERDFEPIFALITPAFGYTRGHERGKACVCDRDCRAFTDS
jgi:hypothetical protein